MKTMVDLRDLRAAVADASLVVGRKTLHAALLHLHLEATDGELVITGTDLDHRVSARIPADVSDLGAVLLHASTLLDLVGRLSGPKVEIAIGPKGTAITSGRTTVRLATMDADAFPAKEHTAASEPEAAWEVSGEILALLAHRVPFATAKDTAWGALHGVNVVIADGRMEVCATNRTMMSVQVLPANGTRLTALLMPDVLGHVSRLFKGEDVVRVIKQAGWIEFRGRRTTHRSKLMAESYPNYQNVIPKDRMHVAVVDRDALLAAVELADVVSVDLTNRVTMSFSADTLIVSGSSDKGEGAEPLPADYEGNGIQIDAPAHQLRPALQRIGSKRVRIELQKPQSVILLRPEWEGDTPVDGEQIMLVMPLRPK